MTDGEVAAKPAQGSPGKWRRALDWLTLSSRITEARESEQRNAEATACALRAERAARTADRVLDSPHALPSEPEHALALYAEAAYWLGRAARRDAPADTPLSELLALEPEHASWLPRPDDAVRATLAEPLWVRAERSRDENARRARAVQSWLSDATRAALRRYAPVAELRLQRSFRLYPAVAIALVALGTVVALVALWVRGPDLAQGRPWRASSSLFECNPKARQCGGATTEIFFHTREEEEPWVEFELEGVQRISRVEVANRSDGAGDRAVPLILEVSTDGKTFQRVAERIEPFGTWKAKFAPVDARYVRLRSSRKTMLHLERVTVRK